MSMSKIEWTEVTWNPVTGCTKISPGCDNCYAEKMARRLKAMGQNKYKNEFKVACHPKTLDEPTRLKSPHMIFVCSMGDLFHRDVPTSFIQSVFETMNKSPHHTFQVLTKRSKRLYELKDILKWTQNIWAGVTVESNDYSYRVDRLREVPAEIRFLSLEPLLGPLDRMDLTNINWVIVGGESGPGARPIEQQWVLNIKTQCVQKSVPFFFKQWGGINKKKAGRLLEGEIWDQMPEMQRN
tara:strand:- start:995 stop:1711 length:717 start_codon:yes stop_codon:yes gene_type:complete